MSHIAWGGEALEKDAYQVVDKPRWKEMTNNEVLFCRSWFSVPLSSVSLFGALERMGVCQKERSRVATLLRARISTYAGDLNWNCGPLFNLSFFLYILTNQSCSTGRQTNKYKPDVKYQWSCDSQVDTCVIKVLVTKSQKKRSWNNKEKMLRATMDGNRLIGKVNPRHRVCYLPHNGKEVMIVKMMMVMIPGLAVNFHF